MRAWVDVQRGQIGGGTVDMALDEVNATLGKNLRPLALRTVTGRVGGRWLDDGFELSTQNLQFVADDGLRWPGGNLALRHSGQGQAGRERGELQADRLDLAALAQIASRPAPGRHRARRGARLCAARSGGAVAGRMARAAGAAAEVPGLAQGRRLALAADDAVPTVAGFQWCAGVPFDSPRRVGRPSWPWPTGLCACPACLKSP